MKIIVFGATGMIGQAVVKEAIAASHIDAIMIVGRSAAHIADPKANELIVNDLFNLSLIEESLKGYDACVYCVGVSAAFMSEQTYIRLTHDLTLSVAETVLRLNPQSTFVYVTGQGTDSSEVGNSMWARVKGKTENALLKMSFKAAYMFRPGAILPMDGIRSKTKLYDALYVILAPLVGIIRKINTAWIPTTRDMGQAMLKVADGNFSKKILNNKDIVDLAASSTQK